MGMIGSDFTNQSNTQLDPAQEAGFQQWLGQLPANLQSQRDYDLRAAYLADPSVALNGHLNDVGKKENHMTFSDGSVHSTPQTPGGHWAPTQPESELNPNGVWNFTASPTNLKYHSADDILNYFQARENNGVRKLPNGMIGYGVPNTVTLPPGTR